MRDRGCKFGGPSCLACRLPICRYDTHNSPQDCIDRRDARVAALVASGLSQRKTAARMGLSWRTVGRACRRERNGELARRIKADAATLDRLDSLPTPRERFRQAGPPRLLPPGRGTV